MEDNPDVPVSTGWTVSKTINVGEIASMLGMIGVILFYVFGIDKRVETNELVNKTQQLAILENKENIAKEFQALERQRLEIKGDLQALSAKVQQTNTEQNSKIDRIYDFILKIETERARSKP